MPGNTSSFSSPRTHRTHGLLGITTLEPSSNTRGTLCRQTRYVWYPNPSFDPKTGLTEADLELERFQALWKQEDAAESDPLDPDDLLFDTRPQKYNFRRHPRRLLSRADHDGITIAPSGGDEKKKEKTVEEMMRGDGGKWRRRQRKREELKRLILDQREPVLKPQIFEQTVPGVRPEAVKKDVREFGRRRWMREMYSWWSEEA